MPLVAEILEGPATEVAIPAAALSWRQGGESAEHTTVAGVSLAPLGRRSASSGSEIQGLVVSGFGAGEGSGIGERTGDGSGRGPRAGAGWGSGRGAGGSGNRSLPGLGRGNPLPIYPADALAARAEGRVMLRVGVRADGSVEFAELHAKSGWKSMDESALEAVQIWRFTPAYSEGRPIASVVLVPVRFVIRN
jgi:protein TonB